MLHSEDGPSTGCRTAEAERAAAVPFLGSPADDKNRPLLAGFHQVVLIIEQQVVAAIETECGESSQTIRDVNRLLVGIRLNGFSFVFGLALPPGDGCSVDWGPAILG